MKIEIVRWVLVFVSAVAGGCVALLLLNRRLLLMQDSKIKVPMIFLILAVLEVSFIMAGLILPVIPWAYVLLVVFLFFFTGEVHRVVHRCSCAGSQPVDAISHTGKVLRPFTTTDIVVHRFRTAIPEWHGSMLRIVHLSDLHVNPGLSFDYYSNVLNLVRHVQPDLVVMTGDFVTNVKDVDILGDVLQLFNKCNTVAVLGNHDYWAGADAVREVIRKAGIALLTDDTVRLQIKNGVVQITGCDTPWGKAPCVVPESPDGVLRIVLSHTPDNIYRISKQFAHMVFSGHNHAGQIRIPFIGSVVVPSVYGRRFDHGHFIVHGTHLFVTSGVGASSPPIRLYCHPDIFVVDVIGVEDEGAKKGGSLW